MDDREVKIIIKSATGKAKQAIKGFAGTTQKAFQGISKFVKGAIKQVFSLKSAFIGLAVYGVKRVIDGWERLTAIQEKAEAGAKQAMISMGRYTEDYWDQVKAVASALQEVSTFGDEAILQGTKFLMTYEGITDDLMPRVMETMTDLAALMKGDFTSAANMLGKASMGMTGELRRVGITVDEETFKAQGFLGVLAQIEQQVRGQARALRETKAGGLEAFGNLVGDLKEKFGLFTSTIKAKIADELMPKLKDLIERIQGWIDSGAMEEKANEIASVMIGWFNTISTKVTQVSGDIQVFYSNLEVWFGRASEKIQEMSKTYLPMIKTELGHIKNAWDSLPDWMKGAGLIGAALFGKKGYAALLAGLHTIQAIKNSIKGAKAVIAGELSLSDYAFSNRPELEQHLADIGVQKEVDKAFNEKVEGSYQHGTDYVPRTGLYTLHQGERVVNPRGDIEGHGIAGDIIVQLGGIENINVIVSGTQADRPRETAVQIADELDEAIARKIRYGRSNIISALGDVGIS